MCGWGIKNRTVVIRSCVPTLANAEEENVIIIEMDIGSQSRRSGLHTHRSLTAYCAITLREVLRRCVKIIHHCKKEKNCFCFHNSVVIKLNRFVTERALFLTRKTTIAAMSILKIT